MPDIFLQTGEYRREWVFTVPQNSDLSTTILAGTEALQQIRPDFLIGEPDIFIQDGTIHSMMAENGSRFAFLAANFNRKETTHDVQVLVHRGLVAFLKSTGMHIGGWPT